MNKTLADEGIYTWYSCANSIFQEVQLDPKTFIDFDKPFNLLKNSRKQVFKNSNTDYYEKVITNKLANFDHSSKLYLYSGLKTTFKLEEYLKQLKNFNSRQLITKFRISDHNLEVEVGRYKKNTSRSKNM